METVQGVQVGRVVVGAIALFFGALGGALTPAGFIALASPLLLSTFVKLLFCPIGLICEEERSIAFLPIS
jgi:hypothetical protein